MLRRLAGFTAIAGSITRPVTFASSWNAPGQPAAKGLGPDTAVMLLTLYGAAAATAGTVASTPASKTRAPRIGRTRRRGFDWDISCLLWLRACVRQRGAYTFGSIACVPAASAALICGAGGRGRRSR